MKKIGALITALLLLCLMAVFAETVEEPWFDMENCDFCSMMSKELVANMTWDQYDVSNGLLILTRVKPEYKQEYLDAMKKMEQLGLDMMAGKKTDVKMCRHCQYYGEMMEAGAKFEHIATDVGDIDLITSDNEEILKMIRTYAKNNDEAMARMMSPEME